MTDCTRIPDRASPIGLFDSGVGGLTVARQILSAMPSERIVYVADQAHVPYGGRDLCEVRSFAFGISSALVAHGCKAVVMACNISSATALTDAALQFRHLPVLGMVLAGAREAAAVTRNGRVGVLATTGTVKTRAYFQAVQAQNSEIQLFEVACPEFVPLVERGETESAAAHAACALYMTDLLAQQVDTVILGCTHYPLLLSALRRSAPHVTFVDPAIQTALALKEALGAAGIAAVSRSAADHLLTTTGDVTAFEHQAHSLLAGADGSICAYAKWDGNTLILPASRCGII